MGMKLKDGCANFFGMVLFVAIAVGIRQGCDQAASYELDLTDVASPPPSSGGDVGLIFCLDVSGSMGDSVGGPRKIDISRGAIRRIFEQIEEHMKKKPTQKINVGLCSFNESTKVVWPIGPFNRAQLESAIQQLKPGGNTAIGDATEVALKQLFKSGDSTKAILIMTDGENNRGVEPEQVVEAIRKNQNNKKLQTEGVEVYLVAFDIDADTFVSVKEAGATVVESRDQQSLEQVMGRLVEEVLLEAQ